MCVGDPHTLFVPNGSEAVDGRAISSVSRLDRGVLTFGF